MVKMLGTLHLNSSMPQGTELEGSLEVSAFDLDGSVLAVNLVDDIGDQYLVLDNNKGEILLRYVGKRVSVYGRVMVDQSLKLLEVENYKVL